MIGAFIFSVLLGVVVCLLHAWRCEIIEDRFNRRFDEAADYWQTANRKLSAENESLRAGYRSMFPHLHECGQPHSSEIEEIRKVIELAAKLRAKGTE
jgi:hypothetical protein